MARAWVCLERSRLRLLSSRLLTESCIADQAQNTCCQDLPESAPEAKAMARRDLHRLRLGCTIVLLLVFGTACAVATVASSVIRVGLRTTEVPEQLKRPGDTCTASKMEASKILEHTLTAPPTPTPQISCRAVITWAGKKLAWAWGA